MKNFFNNLRNYADKLASYFRNKFIENEEIIVSPCIGDIVEFEDGSRNMVMFCELNLEDGDVDVRFVKGIAKSLNNRGRQRTVVKVSSSSESWPPENSKVYRDSMLVYHSSQWRISLVNWLSKKLLK